MDINWNLLRPANVFSAYAQGQDEASRNALLQRQEQRQEEETAYQRQRDVRQDGREDEKWRRQLETMDREELLSNLQTTYQITSGIQTPEQFAAAQRDPQVQALIPDIGQRTFDDVRAANERLAPLFAAKPDVRTVGGSLVRVDPDGTAEELYAPPEKPPAAPSGYRWKADGSGLELIPGYAEGQGALSGTRREAVTSRPMPSRARSAAPPKPPTGFILD